MDKPPVITYGLVSGQLKLLLATAIAFALGRGWLSAVDATALTTMLTAVGTLLVPFAWSWYENVGTKKVPANSVAIIPHTPDDANAEPGRNIAGKVVG